MENMPDNAKDNPVGKREALLADRLRLHKGYRHTGMKIFSKGDFTLGRNWFEGEVMVGDVAEFFQRSGDTLSDKVGVGWSWRGTKGEMERARECLEKVLAVRGTTLEEVRTARGRRLLSQDRRMVERDAALHHGRDLLGAVRMGAGSKPLRPWQVCAGDVIGSGKRVEYVFERYGELYINASDEELVRQGKRTYGEELTRLYDLDLSGWRVIGHYGCGRGYEGRSWYDMGKPFGRR